MYSSDTCSFEDFLKEELNSLEAQGRG